jgi:hypothetical protein
MPRFSILSKTVQISEHTDVSSSIVYAISRGSLMFKQRNQIPVAECMDVDCGSRFNLPLMYSYCLIPGLNPQPRY